MRPSPRRTPEQVCHRTFGTSATAAMAPVSAPTDGVNELMTTTSAPPARPDETARQSARCTSGRSSCGSSHCGCPIRFATATPSWLRSREKIDTVRTASTNVPRPDGARKRPCKTTSSSASGVESPRKRRISSAFEPVFFAAGTSGARTRFGLTGGATVLAAASLEVASTAAPALAGPTARIGYRGRPGKRIAGDYPRLVAVNVAQRRLRRIVWSLWLLVGALGIAAVAVYFATRDSGGAPTAMMPVSSDAAATWPALRKPAPPFALRDESGRAFSLASLRGRPVVVTFIDPLCRDYCPTEARRLTDAAAALPQAQRPTIVAVSVNVYGNSPHILRQDRV